MAERWFQVPTVSVTTVTGETETRPKYWDQVSGRTGRVVTIMGTDYFIVRFRASTSTLDSIESNTDAVSLQESGLTKDDIATYLNDLTGENYTFSEWEQRFFTS